MFDPLPEMVIFLTDGEPSGDYPYASELAELVALGIKVYPVGLGLDSGAMSVLQEIAAATGGAVTQIPDP